MSRTIGVLSLLAAVAGSALSSVLLRRAFELGAEPATGVVVRLAAAVAVLIPLLAVRPLRRRGAAPLRGRTLAFALTWGAMIYLTARGEFEATARMPVSLVILVFALAPVWVGVASRILFGTRLRPTFLVGCALALSGVGLIVGLPGQGPSTAGVAIAAGASLVGSLGLIFVERTLGDADALAVSLVAIGMSTAVALAIEPGSIGTELATLDHRTALLVAAGAITGVAIAFQVLGLQIAGATATGAIIPLEPIVTAILARAILGDQLTTVQMVGGLVTVGGVALALTAGSPAGSRPRSTAS